MRFNVLEPPRTYVTKLYTPSSIQSNHSELTSKTSTHLSFSALKWFEKVRGGSMGCVCVCVLSNQLTYTYNNHLQTITTK